MRVGDLVKKVKGRHLGYSGVVLYVYNAKPTSPSIKNTIVEVLLGSGEVVNWPAHLTEVISV